jgi:hypothetical protein
VLISSSEFQLVLMISRDFQCSLPQSSYPILVGLKLDLLLALIGCQGALCEADDKDKGSAASLVLGTANAKCLQLPESFTNKLKEAAA